MSHPSPLHLDTTYLLLTGPDAESLAGGDAFWNQLGTDSALAERVGRGWLVGEYPVESGWDHWEKHPDGDELIHLAAGEIHLHLEPTDHAESHEGVIRLVAGQTVVVPRGTWHTVDVRSPGRLLTVTWGRDTQSRPRQS